MNPFQFTFTVWKTKRWIFRLGITYSPGVKVEGWKPLLSKLHGIRLKR